MTPEEIEAAVVKVYPEFEEYMKSKVHFTFSSLTELIEWEKWKEKEYKENLKTEVHEALKTI